MRPYEQPEKTHTNITLQQLKLTRRFRLGVGHRRALRTARLGLVLALFALLLAFLLAALGRFGGRAGRAALVRRAAATAARRHEARLLLLGARQGSGHVAHVVFYTSYFLIVFYT